jgi:hypothetical protein
MKYAKILIVMMFALVSNAQAREHLAPLTECQLNIVVATAVYQLSIVDARVPDISGMLQVAAIAVQDQDTLDKWARKKDATYNLSDIYMAIYDISMNMIKKHKRNVTEEEINTAAINRVARVCQ